MKGNFYENPFKIIWYSRDSLLPIYLFVFWIVVSATIFVGIHFGWVDLTKFNASQFISSSITGLSFTLALFMAEKNIFKLEELKILLEHQGEDDVIKGQSLVRIIGPFVFSGFLFLILGVSSIVAPYVVIKWRYSHYLKGLFLSLFILAFMSLFNLLVTMLNDMYHAIQRHEIDNE